MKRKILFSIFLFLMMLFCFNWDVRAVTGGGGGKFDWEGKTCDELITDGSLDVSSESILFDGSSYKANCVYVKDVSTGMLWWKKSNCVVFQVAFGTDDDEGVYKADHYGLNSFNLWIQDGKSSRVLSNSGNDSYFANAKGVCPPGITYTDRIDDSAAHGTGDVFVIGNSDKNMKRVHATDVPLDIPPLVIEDEKYKECTEKYKECTLGDKVCLEEYKNCTQEYKECADILGTSGVQLLKTVKNIIFILVPIILLVLGSLDFAQAVFSQSEDGIKKAQQKFIKRLIIAVVIFLIPSILGIVLTIANRVWPNIDSSLCGII